MVLGTQSSCRELAISRGPSADVDGDIEYCPAQDAHELCLRKRRNLKMQTPQCSREHREGLVILNEPAVRSDPAPSRLVIHFGKIPTRIRMTERRYQENFSQGAR